jgi:hypothetical protein
MYKEYPAGMICFAKATSVKHAGEVKRCAKTTRNDYPSSKGSSYISIAIGVISPENTQSFL